MNRILFSIAALAVYSAALADTPTTLVAVDVPAMLPVYMPEGYWAMGDDVGRVHYGAPCDPSRSYGRGFFALMEPRRDVEYFVGRPRYTVVAARCELK